jgi:hypothetical protein
MKWHATVEAAVVASVVAVAVEADEVSFLTIHMFPSLTMLLTRVCTSTNAASLGGRRW